MTTIGFPHKFDKNVASIVSSFLVPVQFNFADWVCTKQLSTNGLALCAPDYILEKYICNFHHHIIKFIFGNSNAINLIDKLIKHNPDINYDCLLKLCQNQCVTRYLGKNAIVKVIGWEEKLDADCWFELCNNTEAIPFLTELTNNFTENLDKLCWKTFCINPNTIDIQKCIITCFSLYFEYDWEALCMNPNGISILSHLTNNFTTNLDKLNWNCLCRNENALNVVEKVTQGFTQNLERIDWNSLCENKNAIAALNKLTNNFTTNLQKINWFNLSQNENAIPILEKEIEKTPNKIHWMICTNANALKLLRKQILKFISNQSASLSEFMWYTMSFHPQIVKQMIEVDSLLYNQHHKACTQVVYNL